MLKKTYASAGTKAANNNGNTSATQKSEEISAAMKKNAAETKVSVAPSYFVETYGTEKRPDCQPESHRDERLAPGLF